ncbi:aromatic acid exporter family protein [Streptomyces sp. NPDC051577]|uniref:aromatic acid exporter family protein n=1 Tax=Streptomyces sp. NPDC051577 TaxID=3155166 RepID=UPI00342B3488
MPEWDKLPGAVKTRCTEIAGRVRRGVRYQGSERDDLVLGAKTVVAAMGAWMLARHFLPTAVATFAPFTALVALQATVYRSVRHCAQYLIAMTVGAALAASLAAVAGIHGWTFGLLTLAALALGRVRRLGEHGTQVAIVGFFAFSSGQGRIDYIGHLVASVVIGALCGLSAHLVLAPARHTRHRQEAVADLYESVHRRVAVLADTIESENPDAARVEQLRRDWRRLSADADRIRHSIDAEKENGRLNPRRSIAGASQALPRAQEAVDVAQRGLDHVRSISRSIHYAVDNGELSPVPAEFRSAYASLLRTASTALEHIGRTARTEPGVLGEILDRTAAELDRAQKEALNSPDIRPAVFALQGTLLTDAGRLVAELRRGRRVLDPSA